MFSFTFSEVGASFRASNEQETDDLCQELVAGGLSQSQGTTSFRKFCVDKVIGFTTY